MALPRSSSCAVAGPARRVAAARLRARAGERDRADEAGAGFVEEAAKGIAVGGAAEGERAADGGSRERTAGDHECVVRDLRAVTRAGDACCGVDRASSPSVNRADTVSAMKASSK